MLIETAAGEARDPGPGTPGCRMSLRDLLRDATRDAHASLDARLGACDIATVAGYRMFLQVNAAALLPLEWALVGSGVIDLFPDWPQRTRRAAIQYDIACLGGAVRPLPPVGVFNAGELLGVMYVLEGSRLGAHVLLQRVEASPDARVRNATAYLRHGAGQRLWPAFLATLGCHALDAAGRARAIAGAHRAFALFARGADLMLGRP